MDHVNYGKLNTVKVLRNQSYANQSYAMKKNSNSYVISAYATKPNLLRKGQIGDWKSLFSEELNKQFEETFLTKLNGTGLHFDTE